MDYEQTIELEENIKIKKEAEIIYKNFLKNVRLDPEKYKGEGSFLFWNDSYNETFFTIKNDIFYFQCSFLHESYDIKVTPSGIFNAIKNKNRGVGHLESAVRDR